MCDGVRDCADASDEVFCSYRYIRNYLQSQTVKHRSKRKSRNGSPTQSACILPPYPDHGTYTVANDPNARPGQVLESFVLTVSCHRGYGVLESDVGPDGIGSQDVYCVSGTWYQSMPECVRFCKLNPDPSVRYMCHVPGVGFKACQDYVAPGTSVNPICNSNYFSGEVLQYMTCVSGSWDYVALCKADCGRITSVGEQLVIDGTFVKHGELPWHVGIYRRSRDDHEQICGGSLVSNKVVISAAHCFWDDRLLPASDFAVAIGKLYRAWNDARDVGAQQSDVKEIKVPGLFQGAAAHFQEDIAVLILTTPFIYKTYVRPVCYSFDTIFDRWQLRRGKLGKVAGWGLTAPNGEPSPELKVVDMPYVYEDTCIESVPRAFRAYITGDKFCAGYTNGTALCKGDSGGGLVFADNEQGIERYYLRGVVSTAPRDEENECNGFTYSTFTRITKHEEFIKKSIASSVFKACLPFLFQCDDGACVDQESDCKGKQDCPSGAFDSNGKCKSGSVQAIALARPVCVLPPYPDHGIYDAKNIPNPRPGLAIPFFVLTVTCYEGYGIVDSDSGVDKSGSQQAYCIGGEWSQRMPECVRFCKLDTIPSVRYTCQSPGTFEFKTCNDYVAPGTVVKPICTSPDSRAVVQNMKCLSGHWDYIVRCKPECGQVIPASEQLAIEGSVDELAKRGEAPWHVSIYEKENAKLQSTGSLVSNKVVISATSNLDTTPFKFAVVAAKFFYRSDDVRDVDTQRSDVKQIYFKAVFPKREDNIAVLILATSIVYNMYVRPVCLSFDPDFDMSQGNTGKVAIWLYYKDNKIGYNVINVPYIDMNTCDKNYQKLSHSNTARVGDMICAGNTDNSSRNIVGDSGSGLVFARNEFGIQRYYLRGVLSYYLPCNEDCWRNTTGYFVFTKITRHEAFIKQYIEIN